MNGATGTAKGGGSRFQVARWSLLGGGDNGAESGQVSRRCPPQLGTGLG